MTDAEPRLHGRLVTLRPTEADDVAPLLAILAQPEVAGRWPGYSDPERVRSELVDVLPHEGHYAIEHDSRVAGYIQSFEEEDPDFRHASIDLFLSAAFQGQGLGPDAIRTLARYLIDVRGHHRLTIDPAADNQAAIAAYRKVGFRPVGVMRAYQRVAEGTWVDALLMEMLADELVG